MRIRLVERVGSGRKDQYPHGIQLLDLSEELVRAGLPALSAVEAGSKSQPELNARFDTQPVAGEERTLPDGVVRIEYRPYNEPYKQDRLDGMLVFNGLKQALSDLRIKGTSPWSDGPGSELALRVGLTESAALPGTIHVQTDEDTLKPEEADQDESNDGDPYDPDGVDRRPVVERQIRERRGQRQFRDALREWYGDRCLVTACEVLAVLEAAHINPYRGKNDNHPENGLLLRSDIHTLFDLDLLGIEPESLRTELHPDVAKEYGDLDGIELACTGIHRPSRKALGMRYQRFRHRLKRPG
jgi:hypothetical protein